MNIQKENTSRPSEDLRTPRFSNTESKKIIGEKRVVLYYRQR